MTAAQAKKRAMLVAVDLARAEQSEASREDNLSVRELFDKMLAGRLGRGSQATYNNARTSYRFFCEWLGHRADEPARLIKRAYVKQWVLDRRAEVRAKTVQHDLYVVRAAFNWALDAELLASNPCLGVKVPQDCRGEKVVHEAFSMEEGRLLVEKLPDEWATAVRCCLGAFGQRLGDVRALRWKQFDWESRVVRMTAGKTGRVMLQPMLDGFFAWAQEQGGNDAEWVLPRLRVHSNPS